MGNSLFFPTGRNCKIRVNGVMLAYATDLSYRVEVTHVATKTLGIYEVNSIEPTSYKVEGSFSIIRYTEGAVKKLNDKGLSPPAGAHNDGNGIGSWTVDRGSRPKITDPGNKIGKNVVNNLIKDGGAHTSLNPGQLQHGITFDIEIYEDIQGKRDGLSRFRNCRIVGMSTNISNKTTINQTFQFVAQYLDEDSFIADSSGVGQLTT